MTEPVPRQRTGTARRFSCVTLSAVALALGAVGCGGSGSSSDQAVKQTMQRFLAAVGRGDGQTACTLVTPAGQQALAAQIATITHSTKQVSCQVILTEIAKLLPAAVKLGLQNAQVQKVTVTGNTASVRSKDIRATKGNLNAFLSGSAPTKLQKVGGVWKVTS